jgi:hypothetical protein
MVVTVVVAGVVVTIVLAIFALVSMAGLMENTRR